MLENQGKRHHDLGLQMLDLHRTHGFSGISDLGLPGNDNIEFGKADFVIPSFTPQAFQRNAYPFACTNNDCGGDPQQHAGMVGFLIIQ